MVFEEALQAEMTRSHADFTECWLIKINNNYVNNNY